MTVTEAPWALVVRRVFEPDDHTVTVHASQDDAFTALLSKLEELAETFAETGRTGSRPTRFRGLEHEVEIVPADEIEPRR